MTLWPRLAELPLVVESYALERIDAPPGSGYERVTTHVRLLGAGTDGLGEDIYDEQEALLAAGPSLPLAGEWTLAGFCDHLDTLALWPAEPEWPLAHHFRRWTYESAALDLALRQAGRSLHEVLGREPQPVGFVNSLGLGDPPDIATIHRRLDRYPGLRFKLDAVADWTPALMDELAATGAVETVDFKGRYGLDLPELDALLALYDHALTAFPDAVLEDPHDLPEVAERLADHQHRVAYDAPILDLRRPRRPAARGPHRQRQAVAHRRPAGAAGPLRPLRGRGRAPVRRRHGRAGRRPRPGPAARLALPPGRAQRRRAGRLQPRRPARRPAGEPAAGGSCTHRLPPRLRTNTLAETLLTC